MAFVREVFLLLTLPATLACGLIFWLGQIARSPAVGVTLRSLAALWWVWWLALTTLMAIAGTTCEPRLFARYENCAVIPDSLASASFMTFVISTYVSGILAGAALLTLGISEWVMRWSVQPKS